MSKETFHMKTDVCKRNTTYENREQICQKKHIIWKQTSMSKETYHMNTYHKYVEPYHLKTDNKYVKRKISYENRPMQKTFWLARMYAGIQDTCIHMKESCHRWIDCSVCHVSDSYRKCFIHMWRRHLRCMYTYEWVMSQMNRLLSMPRVSFI